MKKRMCSKAMDPLSSKQMSITLGAAVAGRLVVALVAPSTGVLPLLKLLGVNTRELAAE